MNDIRPGYLVKITSWENDADNSNTVEFDGLTRSAAQLLINVAKLFKSYNRDGDFRYGNSEIDKSHYPNPSVVELIHSVCESQRINHGDIPLVLDIDHVYYDARSREDINGFYSEAIYDIIGMWCEGERYRVFDKAEVFLIPENSIKNVTNEFIC